MYRHENSCVFRSMCAGHSTSTPSSWTPPIPIPIGLVDALNDECQALSNTKIQQTKERNEIRLISLQKSIHENQQTQEQNNATKTQIFKVINEKLMNAAIREVARINEKNST